MADTKINPKTRLLFLGTAASPTDVVTCITGFQTAVSKTDINADSFCGADSVPGINTGSITLNGQIMEVPSATNKSYKALYDWFLAGTQLYFKIARAVPATGNIEHDGQCFITALNTSDDLAAVSTYTVTLKIDGDMAVTVAA